MTNIKQLIMMLVALFAISTGAWAQTTVRYAIGPEDHSFTSGQTVEVKDGNDVVATITYGESGGNIFMVLAGMKFDGYNYCTEGNGTNGNSTGGTFYTIVPEYDGTIDVAVILNANKAFYILENGVALEDYNGITVATKTTTKYSFDVSAGKSYKFYAAGTKLSFFGFDYTYGSANAAAAGIDLTPDATRKIWTLDKMPAGDVELQVAYYPGMLTLAKAQNGKLTVDGLGEPFTKLDVPDAWSGDQTPLALDDLPGFTAMTSEMADEYAANTTGYVTLIYGYDTENSKWIRYVYNNGSKVAGGFPATLKRKDIKTESDQGTAFYYATGIKVPEGFDTDGTNIYVESGKEFQVKAVPAEGYHLVSLSDGTNTYDVDADGIATVTMPEGDADLTLTATFSDEYDLAFNALNANTIEDGKATVKVGDTDKTATLIQDGKLSGVKSGQTVTLTAATGYKFRTVEAKKTGSAVLAPALENGATVVIICNWGYATTTFTYTNNGGTFSGQASGYDANYFYNGLELNGKNLSFGASEVDLPEILSVGITFNTESSAYSYTGKGEDFVSFTISVNGTDVTDQLSELK